MLHLCRALSEARRCSQNTVGLLVQSEPAVREDLPPHCHHTVLAATQGLLNSWAVVSCHILLQPLTADLQRGWVGGSPALAVSWDSWCLEGSLTLLQNAAPTVGALHCPSPQQRRGSHGLTPGEPWCLQAAEV